MSMSIDRPLGPNGEPSEKGKFLKLPEVGGRQCYLNVVAAKKPDHWIIRAISGNYGVKSMVASLQSVVGCLDPEIEWTGFQYGIGPGYLLGRNGILPGPWVYSGIYKFDHKGYGEYGPAVKIGDIQ